MTTIYFYKKAGRLVGFSSQGHSSFDEEGSDIVCAAISAVTIMTANAAEGVLKCPESVISDEENNQISIIWEQGGENWEVLLKALQLFLTDFIKQYPHNLQIKISEV
jgi:uncharacterized protein YsxB (DUF464 family)